MRPENTEPKFIDVEKVIEGKNPKLLKILPKFIINYLKKVLHQERLNGIIYRNRDKQGVEFLDAVLREFNVNIKVIGAHHLKKDNSFVVVSNHPLGGLDGMALMLAIGRINPAISMTANDFLMHIENLRSLFVPVNKHGSNAENIEALNKTFESGKLVIFFPAGLCSRKVGNQIIDLEWKKTFLSQAKKHRRNILPVHISGKNSSFFYNLARLRNKIGLKANIEMLYLVDEMFKQDNKDIVITFGKPIPIDLFDKRLKDKDWAFRLRSYVYELEKNADAEFTPTVN
jgi:putative hemolysin